MLNFSFLDYLKFMRSPQVLVLILLDPPKLLALKCKKKNESDAFRSHSRSASVDPLGLEPRLF